MTATLTPVDCADPTHFGLRDGGLAPQPWMQLRAVATQTVEGKSASLAVTGGGNKDILIHRIVLSWTNTTPVTQAVWGIITRGGCRTTLQARSRGYLQVNSGIDKTNSEPNMIEASREVGIGADLGRQGLLALGTGFCIAETRQNSRSFQVAPEDAALLTLEPSETLTAVAEVRFVTEYYEGSMIDGGDLESESSYSSGDTRMDLFAVPVIDPAWFVPTGPNFIHSPQMATFYRKTTTQTYRIPSWATDVDVIVLGGGGSGQSEQFINMGQGGDAGHWAGTSLHVGTDVDANQPLTITVGAGGAAPWFYFLQGNAGGATTISWKRPGGSTNQVIGSGGAGGTWQLPAIFDYGGAAAGDFFVEGIPYHGGGASGINQPGNPPGGGGGGAFFFLFGAAGADGRAWIRAWADPKAEGGLTARATENIGITDSVMIPAAYKPSSVDTMGVSDAIVTVRGGGTQTFTDTIGLADAAVFTKSGQVFTDTVAVADTITTVEGYARAQTDSVTIADAAAAVVGGVQTFTDTAAAADSFAVGAARVLIDTMGVADTATVLIGTLTATDAVGVADTISTSGAGSLNFVDTVGVPDALVVVAAYVRSATDAVGITDTTTIDKGRNFTDQAGVVDAIIASAGGAQTWSDSVGVADTPQTAVNYLRSFTDAVGVSDTATVDKGRTITDTVGATDALTKTSAYTQTPVDAVGVSDDLTSTLGATTGGFPYTLPLVFGAGSTGTGITKNFTDIPAVTDTVSTAAAYVRSITDSVGFADDITTSKGAWNPVFTDTVGAADALTRVAAYVQTPLDSVGVDDDITTTTQTTGSGDLAGLTITYTLGVGGTGPSGAVNGTAGGTTSATFLGTTITAAGGGGGRYNSTTVSTGGTGSGGDGASTGGTGTGATGDAGGGAGGAIGGVNAVRGDAQHGDAGVQAADVNGLQAAVTGAGVTWVGVGSPGSNSTTYNTNNGGDAAGFGCSGGGAGWYGGNGGKGRLGGGGGGASGGSTAHTGGDGGGGVLVCQYTGTTTVYAVLTTGTSTTVPTNIGTVTAVKLWAIGGGGSGAGVSTTDTTCGGGGGAGGLAYKGFTATAALTQTFIDNVGADDGFSTTSGYGPATTDFVGFADDITTVRAIPETHLSDDFNRGDNASTLGSNWTTRSGTVGIGGNQASPGAMSATVWNLATYNTPLTADDQGVSITVGANGTSGAADQIIILGANSAGEAAYGYWVGTTVTIYTATTWALAGITSRATGTVAGITAGTVLTLQRAGNVYTVLKDGVATAVTWTDSGNLLPRDSNHRTCGLGMLYPSANKWTRIDAWAADDLIAGAHLFGDTVGVADNISAATGTGSMFSDTFNRADNALSLTSANWVAGAGVMGTAANAAYPVTVSTTYYDTAHWVTPLPSDDQQVTITLGPAGSQADGDVLVILGADTAGTCAIGWFYTTTATIYTVTGIWSTTQTWTSRVTVPGLPTTQVGDVMGLKRIGNVYTLTKNGIPVTGGTWTDSSNLLPRDSNHRLVGLGGLHAATGNQYRAIDSWAADVIGGFTDHFDGPANAAPDPTLWDVCSNVCTTYFPDPAGAYLDGNSHLVIRAQNTGSGWNAGWVASWYKKFYGYGKVSASIKLPAGSGTLPAFWLEGEDMDPGQPIGNTWPACGEIDIMEWINDGKMYTTVHGPPNDIQQQIAYTLGFDPTAGFHTYWCDHQQNSMTFGVDAITIGTITPATVAGGSTWAYNHGFSVVFDLDCRGLWGGVPNAQTPNPSYMLIDWFKWEPVGAGALTSDGLDAVDVSDNALFTWSTAFLNDTFTDNNNTLLQNHTGELGATWTKHPNYTSGGITIGNDNTLYCSANSGMYYASGTPASADYTVSMPFLMKSLTNAICGVSGRINTAAQTFYYAYFQRSTGPVYRLYLAKYVAGTSTSLGNYTPTTPTAGQTHTVGLSMVGSAISLLYDGVTRIGPISDTSITAAGKAGVYVMTTATTTTGYHPDSITAASQVSSQAGPMGPQFDTVGPGAFQS